MIRPRKVFFFHSFSFFRLLSLGHSNFSFLLSSHPSSPLICFPFLSLTHTYHLLNLSFFPNFHTHTVMFHFLQPFFSQTLRLSFQRGYTYTNSFRLDPVVDAIGVLFNVGYFCYSSYSLSICSLFIRSKNIYGFMIIVWIIIYMTVDFGSGLWWEWWWSYNMDNGYKKPWRGVCFFWSFSYLFLAVLICAC